MSPVEKMMKKKIMVVDNHPLVLKFISQFLEKEGHQVVTAEDGLSALEILKTFDPNIIFIDLIMPHIGGEKLCQIIRKNPKFNETYLIILSAIAAEQEVDFSAFGANACIAKGSLDKMAKHVLAAIEQVNKKNIHPPPLKPIGIDDVYARNITSELLSVKKHFEVVLNSMVEGILEITLEGKIVYANPMATSLIHKTEDEILSSDFLDLYPEPVRESIKKEFKELSLHPRPMALSSPLFINGREISFHFLPVFDELEKTIIILLHDVSEKKRMEAQLLQAQKMEAIGTLAGGIAHDFNNLLMVIQGNVSLMLLDTPPNHQHHEMLKMIEKQVHSGSKLTNQLLGYARKGRYEVKSINLNSLVEETSEAFGRTRKNITIHRDLAPNLLTCEADQGQIEQVLMNLFVNAADAMLMGGDLYLKTNNVTNKEIKGRFYTPNPGEYVMLTVSDSGMGIDSKNLNRIFDPFFTTKELGRGTGLGLASVYGIVKGHDGYIEVESDKGRGATFKVYLPASGKQVQKVDTPTGPIPKAIGSVLLVDDEEVILDVGEKILKVLGYKVLEARGGAEAIEIFKKHQDSIDLVLLDIIMPQMGGGEVYDRLKEISPEVKVLLSSGYSIDGEASKIMARGCNGFIQKPFDILQLSQSIRAILVR
ncbi:MAG: response regulator [Deltaproteobacteria bacterium]|nr:response regulator [Deltaproteobacteria bacterium]